MNRTTRCSLFISCAARFSLAVILITIASFTRAQDIAVAPSPEQIGLLLSAADDPPVAAGLAVAEYSSRPGAAYTLYLDFGGFTFTGNWGGQSDQVPGTTLAYDTNGNASSFSSTELFNIKKIWSRVAEKYAPFNVNVTTIDPAVAAGKAGSDAERQLYYDNTRRLMHTVIGGSGGWTGGGGISYVGVTKNTYTGTGNSNGYHTNWVFSGQSTSLQFAAEATAHENGHGLGLSHQSDYNGNTFVREYSKGTGTGAGSQAPIMGNSYTAERGLWKIGTIHVNDDGPTTQNDAAKLEGNSGIGAFINDGIGHTLATATPLPMNGLSVNFNSAKGVIVPSSSSPTTTTGAANYVADYWSFNTGSGLVSLSVKSGRQDITPGTADAGAMLDATFEILNTSGIVLFTSATTGLSETLNVNLGGGTYIARVTSAGDPAASNFYDMGSYFITGTLVIPEPSTFVLVGFSLIGCIVIARRKNRCA